MPRICCPRCHGTELSWVPVSGRGSVWSSTEVHRAPSAEFKARTPYWVVLVRLDEGPTVMAHYLPADAADRPLPDTRVDAEVQDPMEGSGMPLLAFRRHA
ncbi:OB-fold domain-containing protein [Nocardioides sp. S5]|uniref:Zn-ribbon domain-containing OB-fold protein n=1 Tax=Nocardioides sp. S5 TaxID=2017486 RepID=UPI001F5CFF10|nr:OB-fold domain-containing protein [Nocardioides sp. S5]